MATHGVIVVDKPAGWTSHDVVAKIRKIYRQRRVGHAGTLDPDATGVLLVGLGRATRLLRFLQDAGKGYRATIVFGVSTTTLAASGEVVDRRPMPIDQADIEAVLPAFLGEIEQLPPMVSAVKVGGRRLHELARRGEEVEGLIDILRRTAEAEVTCVLKEEADGTVRVSLRSLGEVDVRGIAEAEGGGGHRFAAGFSSDDGVEAVVGRIQHKLPIAR